MSDTDNFLKFLLTEEIYVIDEKLEESSLAQQVVETTVVAQNSVEEVVSIKEDSPEIETVPTSEVLVLFSNPGGDKMKTEEAAFLQKILSAVKMDINRVDLVNVQQQTIKSNLYRKVIAFTANHGLSVSNKYQLTSGNQMILYADDLTSISSSVDLKKQLWVELQKMFG